MNIFPPSGYDRCYWTLDGTDPKWTRWWAWFPVKVAAPFPDSFEARRYVWLRWVECRMTPDRDNPTNAMQYRLPH